MMIDGSTPILKHQLSFPVLLHFMIKNKSTKTDQMFCLVGILFNLQKITWTTSPKFDSYEYIWSLGKFAELSVWFLIHAPLLFGVAGIAKTLWL